MILAVVVFLILFIVAGNIMSWLGAVAERSRITPSDPIATEAMKLAMQELDEMDYIMGVGPMPFHVATKLKAQENAKTRKEEADFQHRLQSAVERGTRLERGRRIEPLDIPVASFNPPLTVMRSMEYDEHGQAIGLRWPQEADS